MDITYTFLPKSLAPMEVGKMFTKTCTCAHGPLYLSVVLANLADAVGQELGTEDGVIRG